MGFLGEGFKFGISGFLKLRETKECVGIREALFHNLQDLAKEYVCDLLAFGFLALALRSVRGFRNSHSQIHSF